MVEWISREDWFGFVLLLRDGLVRICQFSCVPLWAVGAVVFSSMPPRHGALRIHFNEFNFYLT